MNSGFWLNLLGSGALVTVALALIKFIENRMALKAGKGKAAAETESKNIANQAAVIDTLKAENTRLAERLRTAEERADRAADKTDEIERKFDELSENFYKMQREQARFRDRVEDLLEDKGINIPDWWHGNPATGTGS